VSLGACDGCGQFFAGEVHQVREGLCPACGEPLRSASSQEARAYVKRWEEQGPPAPGDGDPRHEGGDDR
jgi:hypothetical protein